MSSSTAHQISSVAFVERREPVVRPYQSGQCKRHTETENIAGAHPDTTGKRVRSRESSGLGQLKSVDEGGRPVGNCRRLSPQKPVKRAYQRNYAAVQDWLKNKFPPIRKQAETEAADIFREMNPELKMMTEGWNSFPVTKTFHTESSRYASQVNIQNNNIQKIK